jgi:hypothetical protein
VTVMAGFTRTGLRCVKVASNRAHVLAAKAAVSRGLEALILAQSDLPTTGALNPMIKWEKVVAKERVMRLLCCTCILQNCVSLLLFV